MRALANVREVLRRIATDIEVLPAVGGAEEDLERPDVEEREDQALNEKEKVFETIFERDPAGVRLYRPVPPLSRTEDHLFRYFLDGSFRSYFLGTVLEHERESPVHFAQIGACVLRREDDGSMRRHALQVIPVLLAARKRLSEAIWTKLEELAKQWDVELVDVTEKDIISDTHSDFDLRNKAAGKVRFMMHLLEATLIGGTLDQMPHDSWMVADGSLLFDPILSRLLKEPEIPRVVGVSKNFRKDLRFVKHRSIYQLLADLDAEHRTAAFSAQGGKVVFWYVRLREQRHLDYPLMGVVKVELVNPSREPVPSELIDRISRALVAERRVTPHGQDSRWHAHLYPIFLAERAVKESLFSREVVQQYLKWR